MKVGSAAACGLRGPKEFLGYTANKSWRFSDVSGELDSLDSICCYAPTGFSKKNKGFSWMIFHASKNGSWRGWVELIRRLLMISLCYMWTPICVYVACGSITPFTSHLSPQRKRLLRCALELRSRVGRVCRSLYFWVKLPADLKVGSPTP